MITIPNPIASAALARPAHEVLIDDEGALDAAALLVAVKHRAAFFAKRGIRPRQKVALFGEACRDWVISLHALGCRRRAAPAQPGGPPPRARDLEAKAHCRKPRSPRRVRQRTRHRAW